MAFHRPYMTNKGYVMEYHPNHPRADKKGYVFAHIVAYEKRQYGKQKYYYNVNGCI